MKKTDHVKVPILNLRMMSNEEELAVIEECERKNSELYTPEHLAECRKLAEIPCNIPGLRNVCAAE